jgi:hypothetical protein
MGIRKHVVCPIFFLAAILSAGSVNGQYTAINTGWVEEVVALWNEAHNDRNVDQYGALLNEDVLYYTERIPRAQAMLLKKLLFVRNPDYQQQIASAISYTMYSTGIVKCEFNKEVWKDAQWQTSKMYLLIGFKKHKYWILGESDYQTDNQAGYSPDIGEPEKVETVQLAMTTIPASAVAPALSKSIATGLGRETTFLRGIAIPVYFILALISTAIILVVYDKYGQRKANQQKSVEASEESATSSVAYAPEHQAVDYHLKQKLFREHSLRLFDPSHFSYEVSPNNPFPLHPDLQKTLNPPVTVTFHDKKHEPVLLSIQFIYRASTIDQFTLQENEVHEANQNILQYYVIGVGGAPHDPDDLYLLQSADVNGSPIGKEILNNYNKSGFFYYDRTQGKLV